MRLSDFAAGFVLAALVAATAFAQPVVADCRQLSAGEALDRLFGDMRRGGYVLLFRHGERPGENEKGAKRVVPSPAGTNSSGRKSCDNRDYLVSPGDNNSRDVGRFLTKAGIEVSHIYVSPCTRTYDTGQFMANEIDAVENVDIESRLGQSATGIRSFVDGLRSAAHGTNVVLVSHSNLIRDYLRSIVGQSNSNQTPNFLDAAVLKNLGTADGPPRYACVARIQRELWN